MAGHDFVAQPNKLAAGRNTVSPGLFTAEFTVTFDFTANWEVTKPATIASSGGLLPSDATDAQVIAFIEMGLAAAYGDKYSGSASAATLRYEDYDHYYLSVYDPAELPYFNSASVSGDNIDWSLDYLDTPGDFSTRRTSVLSGTKIDNTLNIVGGWFPVSGVGGVRTPFTINFTSLTLAN